MSSLNAGKNKSPLLSQTNGDILSDWAQHIAEETSMANEIYALAEDLKFVLRQELATPTSALDFNDHFKGIQADIEKALATVISKELAINDTIEILLRQTQKSDDGNIQSTK